VQQAVPEAHAAVLRGSSVTGIRHRDKLPFDADGPGTSDLDLTLVGGEVLRYYDFDGYFVPGAHSRIPDRLVTWIPTSRRNSSL
jgi:hypothetical protein